MNNVFRTFLLLTLSFTISRCSSEVNSYPTDQNISPSLATGMAMVARKYTEIAKATLYPPTPFPSEVYPTLDWAGWRPSSGEIVASNSGKTYDFWLTSRFSLVLKESDFPKANLTLNCIPEIVLGQISNVEPVPPEYYVIRYEGSGIGQCIIENGQFEVTINIINNPG